MDQVLGQVISGDFHNVLIRQKTGQQLEIGQLVVAEGTNKVLLQVVNLEFGSQLSAQSLELVAGMKLEEENDLELMDSGLRSYTLARLKPLFTLHETNARSVKVLPQFFSTIRNVEERDLSFIQQPADPLVIGSLRSGSRTLSTTIALEAPTVLSHHVLIPAQTGKGKSNLASYLLWNLVSSNKCGVLVLDPHDEYYGNNGVGLKDHPDKDKIVYYTPHKPPPGGRTLQFDVRQLRPHHFNGVVNWSDAQREALYSYANRYRGRWIEAVFFEEAPPGIHEGTVAVLRRRLAWLLSLEADDIELRGKGIFGPATGQSTIADMMGDLQAGKVVIINTSSFSGNIELLIGSLVAGEIFRTYQQAKMDGTLEDKPVISVLLEEAPRVIGKEALERGGNVFSTIAREGRKFQVGLLAITQLPSLIPRDILANMNTKIILGIEMAPERKAIIESSAQDLSQDDGAIASLDKGEAIITSSFSGFAIPVQIPFFPDIVKKTAPSARAAQAFPELK